MLDWQLEEISEYRISRQTYLTGTENVLSLRWGRGRQRNCGEGRASDVPES